MRTICERITILQIALKCSHSLHNWNIREFCSICNDRFSEINFSFEYSRTTFITFSLSCRLTMSHECNVQVPHDFHSFSFSLLRPTEHHSSTAAQSQSETLKHSIKQLFILHFRLTLARKRMLKNPTQNMSSILDSRAVSMRLIEIFEPAGTLHAGLNILRTLSILTWLNFQPISAMRTISSSFFQDREFSSENNFFLLVWSLKWQFSILIKFFFVFLSFLSLVVSCDRASSPTSAEKNSLLSYDDFEIVGWDFQIFHVTAACRVLASAPFSRFNFANRFRVALTS